MIKKLSNDKWQVQCYGFDKYKIKTRRRRIVHGTKAAANRVESELNKELGQLVMGYHSVTYGLFLKKEYFPYILEEHPTEFPTLSGTISKWCSGIMDLKMEQINMKDVVDILKEAEKSVAFSTVKNIKGYISRSFTYAMSQGFPYNPCDKIRLKNKNQQEYKPRVLTKTEIDILLTRSKNELPQWYPIFALGVTLGCRAAELAAIKRSDVCLDTETVSITKSWSRHLQAHKSTKTGDWRVISLPSQLMPLIRNLMVGRKDDYLLPRPAALLRGKQANVMRKFCKKIGITEVDFHSLRHTCCSLLLASGNDFLSVMSVSGHKSLRSLNTYISASGIQNKGVCEKMNIKLPSDTAAKIIPLKRKHE
ncbi:MAG: site-specific integrase [Calditrichaeota bacterium]|jgi:integrase|nr:site-specific integrase [Calditrichota bacterium]